MKKTITIGRGNDCHIVLSDERVSRRHCLLTIYPTGKMEIKDMSQNGTYVNGIKIPRNANYKIKRDDVVVFAQAEKLNWMTIEDPYKTTRMGIAGAAVIILLAIACLIGKEYIFPSPTLDTLQDGGAPAQVQTEDSKKGDKDKDADKDKVAPAPSFATPTTPAAPTAPANSKKTAPAKKEQEKQEKQESQKDETNQQKPQEQTPAEPTQGGPQGVL